MSRSCRNSFWEKTLMFLIIVALFLVLPDPDCRAATYAYISNSGSDNVSKVPLAGTVIEAGNGPWGLAITPNNQYAYVTNADSDSVSRIVVATGKVDQTIGVGDYPVACGRDPGRAIRLRGQYRQRQCFPDHRGHGYGGLRPLTWKPNPRGWPLLRTAYTPT